MSWKTAIVVIVIVVSVISLLLVAVFKSPCPDDGFTRRRVLIEYDQ